MKTKSLIITTLTGLLTSAFSLASVSASSLPQRLPVSTDSSKICSVSLSKLTEDDMASLQQKYNISIGTWTKSTASIDRVDHVLRVLLHQLELNSVDPSKLLYQKQLQVYLVPSSSTMQSISTPFSYTVFVPDNETLRSDSGLYAYLASELATSLVDYYVTDSDLQAYRDLTTSTKNLETSELRSRIQIALSQLLLPPKFRVRNTEDRESVKIQDLTVDILIQNLGSLRTLSAPDHTGYLHDLIADDIFSPDEFLSCEVESYENVLVTRSDLRELLFRVIVRNDPDLTIEDLRFIENSLKVSTFTPDNEIATMEDVWTLVGDLDDHIDMMEAKTWTIENSVSTEKLNYRVLSYILANYTNSSK